MAEQRNIHFSKESQIQHNVVVSSPVHLQRILMNVLSNALKYNHSGGDVYCYIYESELDETHGNYCFTIADTGIGMSEEFVKTIFEPFSREQKNPNTEYSGTGLGMAITKELVHKLNGTISVTSKQSVGTTVVINIPMEYSAEIPFTQKDYAHMTLEGLHILLVEDNKMNLEIATFMLEEAKANIDVARNGQEAVEKVKNNPDYNLVLMDVMMPVLNGLDATREIRKFNTTIPIIAMTANAFEEDVKQCKAAGMNDHIAKPIDMDIMKATIKKYI